MKITNDESIQSCILRIQAVIDYLKPAELRVANYILANPHEVLTSTINELAAKTNTSYATINRLISRIGYSGFKDLRKNLYHDTLANSTLDFLDVITFSLGSTTSDICKNIYTLSNNVLDESYALANVDTMDKVASMIVASKTLCIIGTGLSGIAARYAYGRFMRIGINCFFDEDCTHYRMKVSLLTKDDVLLAISSSGRSKIILECAEIAKQNSTEILTLSDYAISPLSQLGDVNLFTTPRNGSHFMGIDMPLLIGQIYILDALYMCCCVKMGKKSSELFEKTKGATESEKLR